MKIIKRLGYTFLALAMAMTIAGCKGKAKIEEQPAADAKIEQPAAEVEQPAADAKVEQPAADAKPAGEKPLDHPAH